MNVYRFIETFVWLVLSSHNLSPNQDKEHPLRNSKWKHQYIDSLIAAVADT